MPSLPLRFGIYICASLTFLSLLLLFYTILCISPSQSCPAIFQHDLSFSFKVQLHWARGSATDDDTTPTAPITTNATADVDDGKGMNHHNDDNKNSTTDLGVEDLYEYAIKSPRFRNVKDARVLRQYLLSNAAEEHRRSGWFWGKKKN